MVDNMALQHRPDGVSIEKYFETRLAELEKRLDERFKAQEKAITVAQSAAEKRLDGMNEFRQALNDQSKTFVSVSDLNAYKDLVRVESKAVGEKIDSLNISRATLDGKASQAQVYVSYVASFIAIAIGLIKLFSG